MTENHRVRNLAFLLVFCVVYTIPALFIAPMTMADIISVPMLIFGGYALYLLTEETWRAFWAGEQSRAALGLFGLSSLLVSVIVMRPYGISSRNIIGAQAWLETTHILPIALYIQAIGLMLFSRASATPYVSQKRTRWGQLVAGIIIGALIASSKALEPILIFFSKLFGRLF